jgi:hypothetical protein
MRLFLPPLQMPLSLLPWPRLREKGPDVCVQSANLPLLKRALLLPSTQWCWLLLLFLFARHSALLPLLWLWRTVTRRSQ